MSEARGAGIAGFTRIAAYAVVRDGQGRLLLCRLSIDELDRGWWTLPGGGLDFGEDPAHGAIRELEEEAGVRGRVTDLLGIDSRVYPPRPGRDVPFHAIRVIYRVVADSDELRHEQGGSTDQAAWFSDQELADLKLVDLVPAALELERAH